jgi:hypothetical protein
MNLWNVAIRRHKIFHWIMRVGLRKDGDTMGQYVIYFRTSIKHVIQIRWTFPEIILKV